MPETLHEAELFLGGPVWGGVHRLAAEVEPHAHDFLEIAVIGPGGGRHQTSLGERAVRHGQVVVLRPGAWHAFRQCRDLVVANCCVSALALHSELSALQQIPMLRDLLWTGPVARAPHGAAITQIAPAAADEAIAEIAQLERDLAASGPTSGGTRGGASGGAKDGVSGRGGAGRVLGRLVMVLGILADGRTEQPVGQERRVHGAVAATVARFEVGLAEDWRLDEVAAAVSLDPAYLSRLFRRDTGLSPLGFLGRLRAERAASLLAQTDLPAARVGAAVGWDDPTYFARRFRSLVGSTPTEYRARSRR
ncbi:MAG TPA: AraC family transcriptional regulator [Kribbella sp.]|uniref:AraC family transcriptional regulator n=1 Tax=Kribbella sp. TaxID=1871183 RepID=UPI002D78CA15|nr:AraC family transcriptional regulator [Kribbella sp.]HET6296460.1 AraC family transcriptional regulator [Kribbella sp.]